ncbi:MAG: 30S ribosomal protein S17 [Planctomycetota bacterium]|nr:MAG: 30S ribosomal protein S17 [Planctomycetota bacterium]
MSETTQTESAAAEQSQNSRGQRKVLKGRVVSTKMDKSIVVEVTQTTRHALYHKVLRKQNKFYAHDENNEARVGDKVEIMGTRPLSKLKRWRLVKILEKAPGA